MLKHALYTTGPKEVIKKCERKRRLSLLFPWKGTSSFQLINLTRTQIYSANQLNQQTSSFV